MGETEVPANPQRVIVLDSAELDAAITLGVKPVGSFTLFEGEDFLSYLKDKLDGVQPVGTIGQPNLEAIAALKPDLILSNKVRHENIYPELSAIAPTVFAENIGAVWKDNFKLYAEALGKQKEGEVVIANYNQRLDAFKQRMGDRLKTQVSVLRVVEDGVRILQKKMYIGVILADAGLARPPAQDVDDRFQLVSFEQIPEMDGDVIFISYYGKNDTAFRQLLAQPLWQANKAVAAGQVYPVNDDIWQTGLGFTSANLVIDDLERYLLGGGEQAIVSEAETATSEPEPTGIPGTAEVEAIAEDFPVTIEHKYGHTEIASQPERIVTVGLTDHDALLALGIVPVGTTEWFNEYPGAIWPWAQDKLGDAVIPELVGDGDTINFEKIAALKPDVILALFAGLTQEQYDLLTQIAPTVAQPGDYVDYGIPWQELTRTAGRVVGQAEEADKLLTEVEARFEQVRAEHPEFEGATAIVATPYEGIWVYGSQDVRGRFLTSLGFKLPAGLDEITGKEFGGNLSLERADLLDVDVIIWLDADEAQGPLGGPVYQNLAVHTEGREVSLDSYDDPLGGATSFVSVLSLPFLLDGLVPQLAAALDKLPAPDTAVAEVSSTPLNAAFPVTITHSLGTVEIPAPPQRVVALGPGDIDTAVALGVTPVGIVADWSVSSGISPWLEGKIDSTQTEILPASITEGTISFEQIVELQPDLILGGGLHNIADFYPTLSQIAPTTAWLNDSFTDTWQEQTLLAGRALGRPEQARQLIADTASQITAIKTEYPELAGKTFSLSFLHGPNEIASIYSQDDFAVQFFQELGFTLTPALADLAAAEGNFQAALSLETLHLIDADLVVLAYGSPEIQETYEANPLFQQLKAVQEDRYIVVDLTTVTQLRGPSVLGIPWVLDQLRPGLAKVVTH
jgi:iron complex transport system substrate-binding protein